MPQPWRQQVLNTGDGDTYRLIPAMLVMSTGNAGNVLFKMFDHATGNSQLQCTSKHFNQKHEWIALQSTH